MDRERAGVDHEPLDDGVQQLARGHRDHQARRRRRRARHRSRLLRSGSIRSTAADRHAVDPHWRHRRSGPALLVRRVPRRERHRAWPRRPADAAHAVRRGVRRLPRPPVGAELGEALRAGMGADAPPHVGHELNSRERRQPMPFRICFRAAAAAATLWLVAHAALAQPTSDARAVIDRAAEALGGADAILAVRTLELRGYGAEAYFWGGGNITADPEAVQKWAENPDFQSVWDFPNRRFRTQYRHNFLFPFGGTFGHSFGLSVFGVDGDVAYTIAD